MISEIQKARLQYQPKLPPILQKDFASIASVKGEATESLSQQEELKAIFKSTYGMPVVTFQEGKGDAPKKMRIGVILSGGQAPGGHNVISGIFDAVKKMNADSEVIGFIGGPSGLLEDKKLVITSQLMGEYRNTGGFDIIGSGRTKLETEEDYARSLEVAKSNNLDALIIIGGDDSNTNGAVLADYFKSHNSSTCVVGVPKTIDGDLKNDHIEISFGFDTACKTYSELIGNIARDAMSARKYWHFIKLMGRSASHIALECALQTQPNICLISEEIERDERTLASIAEDIAQVVVNRYKAGNAFGIVLIPEGLIEFIPEMKALISQINDLLAHHANEFNGLESLNAKVKWLSDRLEGSLRLAFNSLPETIQAQLVMDRDPHGNVQVSRIETEKLLIEMVEKIIKDKYSQVKFNAIGHFFGYEGRCAFPSNFDADYCYSLGYNAAIMAHFGLTGYISNIKNLNSPSTEWVAGAIPLTMMMNLERRHGKHKPVIKKALVELDGKPFQNFAKERSEWAMANAYVYPGSIQYYGPASVCDMPTKTLLAERG